MRLLSDVEESRWLARVCQFGLGRPSVVPDRQFHAFDRAGIRIGGIISAVFGVNGRIMLEGLIAGVSREAILSRLWVHVSGKLAALGSAPLSLSLTDWERALLADLMTAEVALQQRMNAVDTAMLERLEAHGETLDLLQTIPRIDRRAAASILAEIGPDMSVFGSIHAFAAWVGLSPGNNESAGKRRHGATRKGSRHLRAALVEAAHGAIRTRNGQFEGFYRNVAVRRGSKRAIVATAHKMARIIRLELRLRAASSRKA